MKTLRCSLFQYMKHIIVFSILLTLLQVHLLAQFNYPDFSTITGLNLVIDATQFGNKLRLTPSTNNKRGAAYYINKQNIINGFETVFQFQITNLGGLGPGADGFAFLIQNNNVAAIGSLGGGIGYSGIPNSIAIEFDTYSNGGDPNANHISVQTNGTAANNSSHSYSKGWTSSIPNMSDGVVHTVKILYFTDTIYVYIDNLTTPVLKVALNIGSTLSLDNGRAWVGFTSSTGNGYENHDILNWSFTPTKTITIISPNGGENWLPNSTQTITWFSSNIENIKLELSIDNGSSWNDIVSNTPASTQSYSWIVSNTPSTECRVKISDVTDINIYDISNNSFSVSPILPTVMITSPNGGEKWIATSKRYITAIASGDITGAEFEYSTDNGSTWNYITGYSTTETDINTLWTLPNTPAQNCRVKVTVNSMWGDVSDITDGSFAIIGAPVIFIPGIVGSPLYDDVDQNGNLIPDERVWFSDRVVTNPTILHSLELTSDGINPPPNTNYRIKVAPSRSDINTIENELDLIPLSKYKGLIEHLKIHPNQYILDNFDFNHKEGENLFLYTYDWRKSIDYLGSEFSKYIDSVIYWSQDASPITIIAHSLGGLVTKYCVQYFDKSRVGKIIFVGTPHLGSPKSQHVALTGIFWDHWSRNLSRIFDIFVQFRIDLHFKLIGKNMPTLYQLFPNQRFFQIYGGTLQPFPRFKTLNYDKTIDYFKSRTSEFNSFLIDESENIKNLLSNVNYDNIDVYNLVGDKTKTIGKIRWNRNLKSSKQWIPSYNLWGDGTVPKKSAESINSNSHGNLFTFNNVEHSELCSAIPVRNKISEILNSSPVKSLTSNRLIQDIDTSYTANLFQITVERSVVLHVYDSQNRHTGPISDSTWETNIPESDYIPGDLSDPTSMKIILLPKGDSYTFVIESQDTTGYFYASIDEITKSELTLSLFYDSVAIQPNTVVRGTFSTLTPYLNLEVDLNGDGTFESTIPPSFVDPSFSFDKRWNLVSMPYIGSNHAKSVLFPTAISNAFRYDPLYGYQPEDTLRNGIGYWLKFDSDQVIPLHGLPITNDTIEVFKGWNLLGSISEPVPISSITSNPPGIITGNFFKYSGGYSVSDTIQPGKGYWVKVNQNGSLILSLSSPATAGTRITIRPTSELPPQPPSETQGANNIPDRFSLEQSYPNPFNPSTTIRYGLPIETNVTITIYNLLGQEVQRLVDGVQKAGYQEVTWSAIDLPSGVYFYRIQAGLFLETKKLVLLR